MSRSVLCRIAALCLFFSVSAFSQEASTTANDSASNDSASSSQSSDAVVENDDAVKLRMSLDKVTEKLTNQRYLLQYNFHQGESVYYEVVHQSSVATRVQGINEEVKSRSKSLKRWDFLTIQSDSVANFMHTIEQVNMWSETTGREPIHYDSLSDAKVPSEYRAIAESIGKPISVVTANRFGKIIKRDDKVRQIDRGTGGLLIPLPPKPILVKTEWAVPASVVVTLSDGRRKGIKTRQRYRLEKVETGIATISLETQVLTPIADARVKSQLIQKLSKGTIKFDIDAGRMISKELDWDETVIGFNGPESNMSFLARMTERLVSQKEVTASRNPLRNTK